MPHGGHFTIRTQAVDVAARTPLDGENSLTGRHALITIADDGVGMAPRVKARAFEPFFTTKRAGNGIGLGLAVVHGIVMQSGGSIELESAPGAGTTFRLLFPLVPTEHLREPVAAPLPDAPHGSETVLVVEDDDSVRKLICGTLRTLGYAVLHAADGPAALESFPAERHRVQLLLTDAVMPTMGGREVAAALRERDPDLGVVYMSGYADEQLIHRGALDERSVCLQKPFTMAALAETVRNVLDDRDRGHAG